MRQLLVAFALVMGVLGYAREVRAQFCPGISPWVFDDVLASDPFCGSITKMAQQGVTLGCIIIDGSHRLYCPNENVTRKQMAGFLSRLGDALLPLTCASGQILKWNGTTWACSNDNTGGGGGGGTVTSVTAGAGLQGSPNPITGSGSIGIAASYQLPQACSNGQVPKSNGSGGWACAADAVGSGTVSSVTAATGLTGGTITSTGTIAVDTAYVQRRVSASCAVGSSIRAIAADGTVTCQADSTGPANAFVQQGNSFGVPARLGTLDAQPLEILMSGQRAVRIQPAPKSPTMISGHQNNGAYAGIDGGTVAGGGALGPVGQSLVGLVCTQGYGCQNSITAHFGTIGGGFGNQVGDGGPDLFTGKGGTVAGGVSNAALELGTVGGGFVNLALGSQSTVAGGSQNTAGAGWASVGGGNGNTANGFGTAIAGGQYNDANALYSAIGGGRENTTSGDYAFVAGGRENIASGARTFASGYLARADYDGCMVFANGHTSGTITDCGGPNRFVARAFGGYFLFSGLGATGVYLAPGSSAWGVASDRESKTEDAPVDTQRVLERLVSIPITTWRWNAEEAGSLHMGPMAQDFHAAFGLGDSDKRIVTVDADGVALAAIQGLNAKLEAQLRERDAVIAVMQAQIAELMGARGARPPTH